MALLMANYAAASSIARKAANDETFTASVTIGEGFERLQFRKPKALMVAGMELDSPRAAFKPASTSDDPQVPTRNLTVAVRAKIQAWPFFADLVHGVVHDNFDAHSYTCTDIANSGFFNFSGQAPYYFFVTGKAKVRLNYVQ